MTACAPVSPTANTPDATEIEGPVWVFETTQSGIHGRGAARIAMKCRGASAGNWTGASGCNYALPTRHDDDTALPPNELRENVETFLHHARERSNRQFVLLPDSRPKSVAEQRSLADCFRRVPANCERPGRMLETLHRLNEVRVILLDANITLLEDERATVLNQYFAANEGLWNAEAIEIVSIGSAEALVANDKYAKSRRYRHRIIGADPETYRDYATQVREILSIAYATKLVCLTDPMGTNTGNHVGAVHLATAAGLQIDDVLVQ